jgi:hypothetical protein
MRWVVFLLLFGLAFAQKPLTGLPNDFAQQVISDLGLIIEECPDNPSAKNDMVLCFFTDGTFVDFRRNWDSWASIRMLRYSGKTFRAWTKGQNFYQTIYTFGQDVLAVTFIPGTSKNLVVLIQTQAR